MKAFFKIFVLTLITVICFGLFGCGESSDSGGGNKIDKDIGDIVFVHATRNNQALDITQVDGLSNYLEYALTNQGSINCVCLDGQPKSASIEADSKNEQKKVAEIKKKMNNFDWSAEDPETDILSAVLLADKLLGTGTAKSGKKTVVIVDSGISTKGNINFMEPKTNNYLYAPKLFFEGLKTQGALIKLDNIQKVVWFGMGNVADPQKLDDNGKQGQISSLQAFYQEMFNSVGVEDVSFESVNSSSVSSDNLPKVSVASLPKYITKDNALTKSEGDSALKFDFGTSDLSDPTAANEELQFLINQMLENKGISYIIEGYTDAVGSEESNLVLSQQRADSIKSIFTSAGISEDRIEAIGKGINPDTNLSDDQMRCVVIKQK
ncbi:MAG: OmpA family protein [Coriobacteriales bacterium]|nr:OmpA family protein [Coriobacteriales bacterium]